MSNVEAPVSTSPQTAEPPVSPVSPVSPEADAAHPQGEEAPPPGVRAMGVVRWTLVVFAAAAAVFAVARLRQPGGAAVNRLAQRWVCPMHPEVVSDRAASCPICGMDLVPAGGHAEPSAIAGVATIELGADRVQLAGVRTSVVTRQAVAGGVRAVGTVVARESATTRVHTRVAGWIEEARVSSSGVRVAAGAVLAVVHSTDLLAAEEELLAAVAAGSSAGGRLVGDLVAPARRRLELLGAAPDDIAAVLAAGGARGRLIVRAPAAGVVTVLGARRGAYVNPGVALYELADLSRVWVLCDVYESELGRVQAGQDAVVRLDAYPGETWRGKVALVTPGVDAATRTVRLRLELDNPGGRLLPGLFGDVELAGPRTEVLAIPGDAVVNGGDVSYVFVVRPGGRFEPRPVTLGRRDGELIEVVAGVAAGERVVSRAVFLIDAEARLQAALAGFADDPSPSPSAGTSTSTSTSTMADPHVCPMGCVPPQAGPGRCAVCGMALVPAVSDGGTR